jgi:Protein of unknown function (DUF3108)
MRIALVAVSLFALAPQAQAQIVDVRYVISLAGLTIGKASMSGVVQPTGYTLNVAASLTGLVGAVAKGKGSGTARGTFGNPSVKSNGFALSASNGKVSRTIQIAAAAGNVQDVVIEPPFEEKPQDRADRVLLQPQHKLNIVDPVSALIMPSKAATPLDKANCDRKLPVFDGSQRFDVVLSYAGTREVKGEGYTGSVLVCSARYVPVAGHRSERKVTKFMAGNKDMDVWLAPVSNGAALIPYRISVKTMIGTSVIEAERFVAKAQ